MMKIMSSYIKSSNSIGSKVRYTYDALDDLLYFLEKDPKNAKSVDINQSDLDKLSEACEILEQSAMYVTMISQ